ncbi:unnamed protein product, partial [Owenia fusiformis]
ACVINRKQNNQIMGLFGKSNQKPPKDQVKEWCSNLRKEGYKLERQIKSIEREEEKVKRTIKDSAKKNQPDVCRILAKELVQSRKTVSKIHSAKAHLNSVSMSMKQQLATLRVTGALEKSTEVMKSMQNLVKVPEVQATMRDMSKEMMKMGIIEEMMEDTFESLDDDELEDEATEEVEKVLFDLTAGELGKAPSAVEDSLPVHEPEGATAAPEEEDVTEMQARLEALRS